MLVLSLFSDAGATTPAARQARRAGQDARAPGEADGPDKAGPYYGDPKTVGKPAAGGVRGEREGSSESAEEDVE
jgi:hypothetical protein